MSLDWAVTTFGEPCRECGYSWAISREDAHALVAGLPARYREITAGATGEERIPELSWNVTEYISHVVDNLRMSGERMIGAIESGDHRVVAFDPDGLAIARRYDRVKLPGALWSLENSVAAWSFAMSRAFDAELVVDHETRGAQTAGETAIANAHDAYHHAWDLGRILGRS
ncbi:MAG: hypothetical protein ABI632_08105 [Pseudolysinimonas sp.]